MGELVCQPFLDTKKHYDKDEVELSVSYDVTQASKDVYSAPDVTVLQTIFKLSLKFLGFLRGL